MTRIFFICFVPLLLTLSLRVAFIHAKGIKVYCVLLGKYDHPDTCRKAVEYGIDLIQTDDVDAVRRIYKEFQTHDK